MDTIANLFSSMENAFRRQHNHCDVPFSKISFSILHIFYNEGFIQGYQEIHLKKNKKLLQDNNIVPKRFIRIFFKYNVGGIHGTSLSSFHKLKRISHCGKRVYISSSSLLSNKKFNGLHTYILSTSKGIMSDKDARSFNIGGELLGCIQ